MFLPPKERIIYQYKMLVHCRSCERTYDGFAQCCYEMDHEIIDDWMTSWKEKNETLRKKYNLPQGLGQTWECFDGCQSGCYKGCDRRCYACYILHDTQKIMEIV